MEKKLLIVVIAIGYLLLSFNQEKSVDKLIKDFQSSDWPTVLKAKESLENMEGKSIPELINLLGSCPVIKLENTGDLIYPGAEKFYGHGQIIDYDIDDICIRAGWLIEEIAFQKFGFDGVHVQEDRLINYIKFNFAGYYNKEDNKDKLEKMSATEKRNLIKDLSIKKAKKWWEKESKGWNRLSALVDALKSDDEKRQVKALFYIRNGRTQCTGLTKSYYKKNIHSIVNELSKVQTKRVSEHAKLILLDMNYEWLKIKQI
ncbi:MAG: hypothetical protein JSV22_01750 [Bacteroidales bacterium]|nr:MAG: hypothetical protein JSV22_01750 [Bacteroidales bacterium]